MSETSDLSSAQSRRFGSCWVWSAASLPAADALVILRLGDGDPGLVRIGGAGRGSAWTLKVDGESAVLRHYQRGGVMARFNRDLYFWAGANRTRSAREFALMSQLADAGLPVPRPIAALACRTGGIFYRAAILTRYVENRGCLCDVPTEGAWRGAGQAIARMHRLGVWHADLNVHNILIDAAERAWLIDFDRALAGQTSLARLQENLSRLLRSVRKVCPELGRDLWPVLLEGYANP